MDAWRFGAFALSESVYEPHVHLPAHSHARAYLGLVVSGSHRETTSREERDCGRSSVVFHPAAERHANLFSPIGGRIFRLEIGDEWLARLRECEPFLDQPAESHGGRLSHIASRILSEFRLRDQVSSLAIESLTLEFATSLVRELRSGEARGPSWLRNAVGYLHARVAGEIQLSEVAAAAGVHPAHLNRVFRTHYGCSIGQYVRRMRIDRAARELVASRRRSRKSPPIWASPTRAISHASSPASPA